MDIVRVPEPSTAVLGVMGAIVVSATALRRRIWS
jgi:hypothetical protein